ncbi:MAG TPA: hypothetical protein VJH75_03420 [Patescibacteria group bacterium]|nr:hypothetical protein [Patescibacteria group bacterium]
MAETLGNSIGEDKLEKTAADSEIKLSVDYEKILQSLKKAGLDLYSLEFQRDYGIGPVIIFKNIVEDARKRTSETLRKLLTRQATPMDEPLTENEILAKFFNHYGIDWVGYEQEARANTITGPQALSLVCKKLKEVLNPYIYVD